METNQKTAVARQTDPNQSLTKILNDAMPELRKVAPKFVNVTRMVSLAIEAKMRNPLLEKCSPVSVLNFCKKCAETGTDRIGAGGMWAVPFWSNKNHCYDMVPIPDWRLLIEKAKKAKAILHATAEAVYAADEFAYERGMTPTLTHRPARTNRGDLVAVYCVYTMTDGTKDFVVMDFEADIVPIRNRTNAWKSYKDKGFENPWVTDPAEQAKKTVVKRAMKIFEGASVELTALLASDNIINGVADDAIERAPIHMPVMLPKAIDVEPDPAPAPQPQAAPEPPASPSSEVIRGVVTDVKQSPARNGATKYGVILGNDKRTFGTFSNTIGDAAKCYLGEGVEVEAVVAPNGKYWDLLKLEPVDESGNAATTEDLPFN